MLTMARAICVTFSKSLLAPVVTSPNVTIHLAGSIGKRCLAFYNVHYESIFNSPTKGKNEWYGNLKIIQFDHGLKKRVKDSIGLLK